MFPLTSPKRFGVHSIAAKEQQQGEQARSIRCKRIGTEKGNNGGCVSEHERQILRSALCA